MPVTPYSYKRFSLDDVLIDIAVRFILNCPEEDLSTLERFFFQVEEAHWFYEDFARVSHPALPHMTLKSFVESLFLAVPLLKDYITNPIDGLSKFRSYKSVIPVRGGIILNETLDKVLMVQPWKSRVWVFPRGKINKNESDEKCAIREVLEETGFDMGAYLVPNDFIEVTRQNKNIRLYVVKGVPESTVFKTQTRKEISEIKWHKVQSLPVFSKSKKVAAYQTAIPFLYSLKQYIARARGEVSELSTQETNALKNLLGLNGQVETDQASAQRLVSMIQAPMQAPLFPPAPQFDVVPMYQDRQVIMDLFKNRASSEENIKSAQHILQLLQHEIATEEVIKTPAKIIVPASESPTPTPGNYASPPPVPPNTMLQSLLTNRKGTNSGMLSVLGGERPSAKPAQPAQPVQPMKSENNLLSFLKTGSTMSSSGKSLMSLLKGPEPETLNATANPSNLTSNHSSAKYSLMAMLTKDKPLAEGALEKPSVQNAPANNLMDLLKTSTPTTHEQTEEATQERADESVMKSIEEDVEKPTEEHTEKSTEDQAKAQTAQAKPRGKAESDLLGLLKASDAAVSAEPVGKIPEPQSRTASSSLMELLNGKKEVKSAPPPAPAPAPPNVSLMELLNSGQPTDVKTEADKDKIQSTAGSELMNLLHGGTELTAKAPANSSIEQPKQAEPVEVSKGPNLMDLLKPRESAVKSAEIPDTAASQVKPREGNGDAKIDAVQPLMDAANNSTMPLRESSPAASSLMNLLQSAVSSDPGQIAAEKQEHAGGSVLQSRTESEELQNKRGGDDPENQNIRQRGDDSKPKQSDQKKASNGKQAADTGSSMRSPAPQSRGHNGPPGRNTKDELKSATLKNPSKPPLLTRYSRDTPKGTVPAFTADGYPIEQDLVLYLRQVLEIA